MSNSDSYNQEHMSVAILNGVPKEESGLVTDEASSEAWDRIAAHLKVHQEQYPGSPIDIPHDI